MTSARAVKPDAIGVAAVDVAPAALI